MPNFREEILNMLSQQSSALGVVPDPDCDDECYQVLRIAGEPATDRVVQVSLNELQAMVDNGLLVMWEGGYKKSGYWFTNKDYQNAIYPKRGQEKG